MKPKIHALNCGITVSGGRLEQRAAIVALRIAGIDSRSIAVFTSTHPSTVRRWVRRTEESRPLSDAKRCGRPRRISEASRIKTIAVYCQHTPPLPGVARWSLRDAQRFFKEHPELIGEPMSHATIHRILLEHSLRPHRRQYYLQITDPDFFAKTEHIISCYLNAPENLYCFDECTCIQALNRSTPTLPAMAHQPVREDFDYERNGTTDLMAFLHPSTGRVYGECTDNHDRHTFCRVFSSHVQMHSPDSVLHYIMDNLSPHYHDDFCQTVAELSRMTYSPLKTGAERRHWLQSPHKRIVVHFVPFHASWLNMVEIWFGILKKKCLSYGHFTSVEMLREAIISFINTWNDYYAHPFRWSYTGEGLHRKAVQRFSLLLSIESPHMGCKFLTSQLLLMSNIADSYQGFIPSADWLQLIELGNQKQNYLSNIIETEPGPKRKKQAREAYHRFVESVLNSAQPLAEAA